MNQLPSLEIRVQAFIELGQVMGQAANCFSSQDCHLKEQFPEFYTALHEATFHNPWFTPASISFALREWHLALKEEEVKLWIKNYESVMLDIKPKQVAVVMAGNIPLVGFHDFICTLMAGHHFVGKLSSNDTILLPAIADILCSIEPSFRKMIEFTKGTIKDFDAIIATGSNNTARYFEYYFSKYPHIIRKNRNGVAVLAGDESEATLVKLGSDICTYYGLGCRNVSKIFIPQGFDPCRIFVAVDPYNGILSNHHKYMNNHSYQRSIYLLNNTTHFDNGVFLLTESKQYSSPIPVLYYEFYENAETLHKRLIADDEFIQCIANDVFTDNKSVSFGCTQSPGLTDYADGTDTMKFLVDL